MISPTDLGPLAFTAEDFQGLSGGAIVLLNTYVFDFKEVAAEIANRLLAEKLSKAPEVTGMFHKHNMTCSLWSEQWAEGSDKPSLSARLVCVKKL